jgi:hypothetical protein
MEVNVIRRLNRLQAPRTRMGKEDRMHLQRRLLLRLLI